MNKRLLGIAAMLVVIFLSACQKELSIEDGTGTTTLGSFRAKINGVQWEADSIKTALIQGGVIVLYGSSRDNKSMLLRVADSGVHNYTLHTQSMTNVGVYTDSAVSALAFATNQWSVAGSYGNLNVTSIDTVHKTISGTFSMKVYRQMDSLQRTITEGVFANIPYTASVPPPAATDSFMVKINGIDFVYNQLVGISAFGKISISFSMGAAPTVGITVPDTAVPGSHPFDILNYIGQYNPSTTVFLGADTGTITILEHNLVTKRIRGNFNFLANTVFTHLPPSAQLSQGYFSVKYN